jgi:hypothetical protein
MILEIYTIVHVLISLVAIFTGLIVLFGMLGVTGFGLVLTRVFYVVIMWFKERRAKTLAPAPTEATPPLAAEPALY